MTFSNLNLPPE